MAGLTQQMLADLIERPSRDTYVPLWEMLTGAADYNPYSNDLDQLETWFEQKQYRKVLEEGRETLLRWIVSPRVHLLASWCHRNLGDEKSSEVAQMFAAACAEGILSTGDGSAEQPYLVTRTSDEYDILMYLQKKMQVQALVSAGDRTMDRMDCKDGMTVYFDITRMYATLLPPG